MGVPSLSSGGGGGDHELYLSPQSGSLVAGDQPQMLRPITGRDEWLPKPPFIAARQFSAAIVSCCVYQEANEQPGTSIRTL